MDNFAVAVLGFYWANQLASDLVDESTRHKEVRENFLRYEQLTGYVRYYGRATDIMGITRIKSRIHDDTFKLTLGQSSRQQILSNQASYGLWGLYSTAARDTGLLSGNDRVVTELGQIIVQAMLEQLGSVGDKLFTLLTSNKPLKREYIEDIGTPFMAAIHHESVQHPLLEALMSGNDPESVQSELWQITRRIFSSTSEKPNTINEFIQLILANNPSDRLSQYIHDIMAIERLLVASNNIFHYCRRKDGEHLDDLLKTLEGRYQYAHLPERLPEGGFSKREQLSAILVAFRNEDLPHLINLLLQLNKEVMQQRSGAPWVELESGNTLRVKVKSEKAELGSQSDIEQRWDYDYFLGSFLNIARLHLGQL